MGKLKIQDMVIGRRVARLALPRSKLLSKNLDRHNSGSRHGDIRGDYRMGDRGHGLILVDRTSPSRS